PEPLGAPRVSRTRLALLGVAWVALIAAAWPLDAAVTRLATTAPQQGALRQAVGLVGLACSLCFMLALFSTFANGRRLLAGFATTIFVSTALTHALKFAIGRARPRLGLGAYEFL